MKSDAFKSFLTGFIGAAVLTGIVYAVAIAVGFPFLPRLIVGALMFAFFFGIFAAVLTLSSNLKNRGNEVTVGANLWRGIESVGGRLSLKDDGLVFTPHGINVQSAVLTLPYAQIASARTRNTLLFMPNGMLVTAKDGTKYQFVLWNRGMVINLIRKHIQAPA